jgi:S1-C subfamily serine protease
MRWLIVFLIANIANAAPPKAQKLIQMKNGRVYHYERLKVHPSTIFVEMDSGGKTFAYHVVDSSSVPAAAKKEIRANVLNRLKAADRHYEAERYVTARNGYRFVQGNLGFLTSADVSKDKKVAIEKKAKGLILIEKKWTTIEAHAKFKREQHDKAMKAKGMVKHGTQWVTPKKKKYLEAFEKAKEMVRLRSRQKVETSVVHSSGRKALCRIKVEGFDGVVRSKLIIVTDDKARLKKGKVHKLNLYWVGVIRYFNDGGFRVAVGYDLNAQKACEKVIEKYHLMPSEGSGTGFAITKSGYVITNHHVIDNAYGIVVHIGDKSFKATMIAEDQKNDLAIIKIDGELTPLALASGKAKLGQTVFTVGFPMTRLQGKAPKVTRGVVSGMLGFKDDERMYQTDVAVQAGNSGGALADEGGNLVGVICAKASFQAFLMDGGTLPENVNYAIKKEKLVALLKKYPKVQKELVTAKAEKITFEDAVARAVKATVRIVVNADDGANE